MAMTSFRPEEHGFAFVNSFTFDQGEHAEIRQTLAAPVAQQSAAVGESGNFFSGIGDFLSNSVFKQLEHWIDEALPDYYGLCGGMAFTAADYYRAGKPLPRGKDYYDIPQGNDPYQRALRDHLWTRQLQSLRENAPILINWMFMLHMPFGGTDWLLDRTREEWEKLKVHLNQDDPWPICLIGSSTSPFNNHQVLAIGYEDPGDGTGTLYVYDMNGPGCDQTITLDMRGKELVAIESCPNAERGNLRGFFVEHYTPASPVDLPEQE